MIVNQRSLQQRDLWMSVLPKELIVNQRSLSQRKVWTIILSDRVYSVK